MGHLSALANSNDEKDAVISDLEHRDDREAATESEPTTFEDRYMKRHSGEEPLKTNKIQKDTDMSGGKPPTRSPEERVS